VCVCVCAYPRAASMLHGRRQQRTRRLKAAARVAGCRTSTERAVLLPIVLWVVRVRQHQSSHLRSPPPPPANHTLPA
jgi:hypothetical protein